MNEIITTLETLRLILSPTTFRQLTIIIEATLAMTGRVTMEGISRWTEKGGSYRTVQRFFNETHSWSQWRWLLIKALLSEKLLGVWILIADEVVVTKAGKHTHGLGKFFSSIQNQPVPGLCFLSLSLLNVDSKKSYPLVVEQLVREEAKESAPKAVKNKTSTGKVGRPKGGKNKNHADVELSAFQLQLQGCIRQALGLIGGEIKPNYLAYDGAR